MYGAGFVGRAYRVERSFFFYSEVFLCVLMCIAVRYTARSAAYFFIFGYLCVRSAFFFFLFLDMCECVDVYCCEVFRAGCVFFLLLCICVLMCICCEVYRAKRGFFFDIG